jgi:hypothetical protein
MLSLSAAPVLIVQQRVPSGLLSTATGQVARLEGITIAFA